MEPKLVEKGEFKVVGIPYYGKNENGEIPKLWGVFNQRDGEIKNKTNHEICFGVCDPDMSEDGKFHYTICVEVSSFADIPEGMITKIIPAGKYLVFTHNGPVEEIAGLYRKIYGTWLPNSKYEVEKRPDFEYYDKRFCERGELDLYIPIK